MEKQPPLEPHSYWQDRFEKRLDLSATGYIGMGETYNRWLYRGFEKSLKQLLKRTKTPLSDRISVIDAGAGSGFLEDFLERHNVANVTGLDFTEASIQHLSKRYPNYRFHMHDLTQPVSQEIQPADLVFCISVLYHIVSKEGFAQALANLVQLTQPGGYLILADNFFPRSQPYQEGIHQRHWALPEFEAVFDRLDLRPISLQPIFFFLNAPVRFSDQWCGRLALRGWRFVQRQLAGREKAMKCAAPLAYFADAVCRQLFRRGPGIHYWLLQRTR